MKDFNKQMPDLSKKSIAATEYVKQFQNTIELFENRCTRLEKKMQFYNIKEPLMNYDWSEQQTREVVEEITRPTIDRMIEIQSKFGTLCEMQIQQGKDHNKMYKTMEDAMGLGKGTLKQ